MEGVVDDLMREILSAINPYDLMVTEFIRVVNQKLPNRVFYRLCPELFNEGKTLSGTPVRVQLLGQHPQWMAENAIKAIELGSHGIDVNFGCPAKIVNRNKGGAVLLQYPEQLYQIIKAIRQAVPQTHAVTAKIRLGFEDKTLFLENAQAIYEAGATEIAVHARSKVDGYKPPAYWEYITQIKQALPIPVIANGEIWNRSDALKCMQLTHCNDIMVGRGAIALPNLAACIKSDNQPYKWKQTLALMLDYTQKELAGRKSDYYPSRIKQWFTYLNRQYPEANQLFRQLRVHKTTHDIVAALEAAHQQ
ncbi:tRNA-dihydrouridine synthase [uncultured Shewanella sp.]|uniref:tRNA-dihydrouridine synthase n=1 Tax=uncultured Shewanella sp. TaxID=173975 RepID=UPI00262E6165|nr:tRNA-dihydrouridine synthase [uncultured Shewanella sp.]